MLRVNAELAMKTAFKSKAELQLMSTVKSGSVEAAGTTLLRAIGDSCPSAT